MERFYVKIVKEYTITISDDPRRTESKSRILSSFDIQQNDIKEIETFLINSGIKKSIGNPKKPVRCIETNMIFETKAKAGVWLKNHNLVKIYRNAVPQIRAVCIGRCATAYGYHWEYVN